MRAVRSVPRQMLLGLRFLFLCLATWMSSLRRLHSYGRGICCRGGFVVRGRNYGFTHEELDHYRCQSFRLVRALALRLDSASDHVRKCALPSVVSVVRDLHIAFVVAAVVLRGLPDDALSRHYLTGFHNFGLLERSRVLREVDPSERVSIDELLIGAKDSSSTVCGAGGFVG